METLETSEGNTKTSGVKKKRSIPSKRWVFTMWEDEKEILETKIKVFPELLWGYGEEICPSTGKMHFQGWIASKKKLRPIESFGTKSTHWEHMRGSIDESVDYCSKEGVYYSNYVKIRLIDPMDGLDVQDWQKEIYEIIKKPVDDRKIYWYYDTIGGKGKSAFAKHLCMKWNAISVCGKAGDIKFAVQTLIASEKPVNIVIWDIPRSNNGFLSYQAIEEIKNGCMFSTKFESGMVIFNPPHIIVFSNERPNIESLSADRWVVKNINDVV